MQSVVIGSKTLSLGDLLVAGPLAFKNAICPQGIVTTVKAFKLGLVGLYCTKGFGNWGSLDGMVAGHHGYWIKYDQLKEFFHLPGYTHIVVDGATYKNRDISGCQCRILHQPPIRDYYFVELDKNVSGGCGDGLGKRGHCVPVHIENLTAIKDPKVIPWD